MSNDNLKLVARIEDQFTGPLAKLRHGLVDVTTDTKKHAGSWRKDWDEARGGVTKFEGALNNVTPILSRLGVSGVGIALSLGGMASALGEFSLKTRGLSQLSKDIGLTVDQLRAFQGLGERFGVTADAMAGAAKTFAGQMFEIKRQGSTFIELQAMNLGKLAEDLAGAKNMEQAIERGMEGLRKIPDAEVRRRVSRLLFGTDDVGLIASNLAGTVKGALGEVSQAIGKMDKETEEAAKNFQGHLSRISEAAERLKLKTIGPLLKGIVGLIDDVEKNGLAGNEQEQATRKALSPFGGEGPSPREKLEGRRSSVQQQLDLLEKNPDAPDYRRKRDRMVEELKRVADELERLRQQGGASISPSSFGGPAGTGNSLIQKAAWGGGGFGGPGGYGGGPLAGTGGFGGGAGGGGLGGRSGGGSQGGGHSGGGASGAAGNEGQFTSAPPEAAGTYRPQRKLTDRDLSDAVVNTIAGEARLRSAGGADAVINNMFNRLGTKGWGPSRDLQDVARAPGQYAGYRRATEAEATFIRDRIKAIASGGVPDNTSGSNSFRASWYRGPWWQKHGRFGKDVAGNTFGFVPGIPNGPYAPYKTPKATAEQGAPSSPGKATETSNPSPSDVSEFRSWRERMAREGKAPLEEEDDGAVYKRWQRDRAARKEADKPSESERPGDAMMRRLYGQGGAMNPGKGTLHIKLEGGAPGTKVKASMDDLFRKTTVERSRSQMDMA